MSVLTPIAAVMSQSGDRQLRARSGREQMQQMKPKLLDHLVGDGEQRWGYSEAKRLRGLEVDRQFELGQPLDWQIAWLGAPEDTTDVESGMTISFRHTIAVAHKAARGDKLAVWIDSSYRV